MLAASRHQASARLTDPFFLVAHLKSKCLEGQKKSVKDNNFLHGEKSDYTDVLSRFYLFFLFFLEKESLDEMKKRRESTGELDENVLTTELADSRFEANTYQSITTQTKPLTKH